MALVSTIGHSTDYFAQEIRRKSEMLSPSPSVSVLSSGAIVIIIFMRSGSLGEKEEEEVMIVGSSCLVNKGRLSLSPLE